MSANPGHPDHSEPNRAARDDARIAEALQQAARGPTRAELRKAPLIENWWPVELRGDPWAPRISMWMTGHEIWHLERLVSAPIVAICPRFRWVLSLNGWRWMRIKANSFAPERRPLHEHMPMPLAPNDELRILAEAVEHYRQLLERGGGRPVRWL